MLEVIRVILLEYIVRVFGIRFVFRVLVRVRKGLGIETVVGLR